MFHSAKLAPVFVGGLLLFVHDASAASRVALVIGNSAYKNAIELANPRNDASDMVATLKSLGFEVLDGVDLDKAAMDRKVREFADVLPGAEAAVFFYAGHGLQVAGVNYLVPVDARLATAAGLDFETVRLDLIQRAMEREARMSVLFLDACRDNPLARSLARSMGTRSGDIGRGLAPAESGVGTLISYSTQPGNVALDGTGQRNSPFAAALVRHLSTSTDALSDLLVAVRKDVMEATANKQVPWEHSALTERFYFNAAPQVATPTTECEWLVGNEQRCLKPKDTFKDCADCPEMVVVPSGEFIMGSADNEEGRWADGRDGPQHRVVISRPFAVGKTAVMRGEFAAFVKDSGHNMDGGCITFDGKKWSRKVDGSWRSPGFEQDDLHPVVCVSWQDAKAYASWLSKKIGRAYRLLTEAEREYATRGGAMATSQQPPYFGKDARELCQFANGADWTAKFPWKNNACTDGHPFTAPVGSFRPNAFGLYDLHGNSWDWVEDCWNKTYDGAPTDGSAWISGNCDFRAQRGGTWTDPPWLLRASSRERSRAGGRTFHGGFRVARTL